VQPETAGTRSSDAINCRGGPNHCFSGISYFLTDRSRWRKIVLVVGVIGAGLSFVQGYINLERAGNLLNELSALHEKQDYWDVSKLSALGLTGIAKAPLVKQTHVIASYVKLEPKILG
jgi:hypothetical protein